MEAFTREQIQYNLKCVTDAVDDRAYQVVVSSQVITRGGLMRGLERRLPHLCMIERNVSQSLASNISQCEADITVSPGTGIMLTTLQRLRQRPLPGQTSGATIRAKVVQVAPRYSSLTVLISEDASALERSKCRDVQEQDCEAITEFIGWTSLIETCVSTVYVAGSENELASWICGYIQRASITSTLLPEESPWEHLLRTSGLNAVSAQTVLAVCTAEQEVQTNMNGLAQLFTVEVHERRIRYAAFMGGTDIADRLSSNIGRGWFAK